MGRRVTIVDVAQRAGVAISSASAALNERPGVSDDTRERIKTAARELGYVPSIRGRSLSTKKAFSIGLVVRRSPEVLEEDPFFGAFIGGIERALAGRGYALVLQMASDAAEEEARYRDLTAGRRVDGVILNELRVNDSRLRLVRELELPAVAINPAGPQSDLASVHQPSAPGVRALVGTLVDLGHTAIAHVAGPADFVHSLERADAWRGALVDAGLEARFLASGDFTYDGGRRAADALLAEVQRPTAVVCANDLSAAGFMIRAQELGYDVPGDISVCGYDGIAWGGYIRPTLTTVQATPRELGAAAATLLLEAVDSPAETAGRVVELPPGEPVVRDSIAPARPG